MPKHTVEQVLDAIKGYAGSNREITPDAEIEILRNMINYAFCYMERKQHLDAPVSGPEVDDYEDQDSKIKRVQASTAMDVYIEEGLLKI